MQEMAVRGGYQGKLLEVDLTQETVGSVLLPPEETLRQWIGCAGLSLHLLAQEVTPDMKPTDPECPVFMMTGPLTGTLAPSSANWSIVSLHGQLPYHVGIAHSHGHWGARLKHAGWDGVIVRGASSHPVYLWVDDDTAELRDAQAYWGVDTIETCQRIALELGDPDNISVACIGPGGENLIAGASVRTDMAYGASKGSPGVVWGAKKLKAIAVRGTGKVPIAHPSVFTGLCERWKQLLEANPVYNPGPGPKPLDAKPVTLSQRGAEGLLMMRDYGLSGRTIGKNITSVETALEWGRRLAEELPQWKVTPVGSWQCDIQCHSKGTIGTGPMAGCPFVGYFGGVSEAMGPNLGIVDPGVSVMLSGVLDGLGLDCAEIPAAIAMVMEAYNQGLLTLEDTDGLDLSWGNYEGVLELLDRIVRREGIGATMAQGVRATAQTLGIEHLAVHIKGLGYTEHDPRVRGIPLVFQYIMSGAGPARQVTLRGSLPDMGFETPIDVYAPDGMGEYIHKSHVVKMWQDTTGECIMSSEASIKGILPTGVEAIQAAVGWQDFQLAEALLVGERVANLLRLLSLYRGYKPDFDFDFSPRLVEPVPTGPAKGNVGIGLHFSAIREQYYRSLGWDPQTGVPYDETLRRVGLADYQVGK